MKRERQIPEAIKEFLDRHEEAGSPNELTVTGLGECKVNLGDLRALVRAVRRQDETPDGPHPQPRP